MANFDRLAEQGKPFFLRCDQRTILRRFPGLEADAGHLSPRFCGERFAVDRETGDVTGPDGQKAGPAETLAIFDWLCHQDAPVRLAGSEADSTRSVLPAQRRALGARRCPPHARKGVRGREQTLIRKESTEPICRRGRLR